MPPPLPPRAGCRTRWPRLRGADAPLAAAATHRLRNRCRPAQWRASARSRADHFRFSDVAESELANDEVAKIGRIADGIERFDVHLFADEVDADHIVGGRAGDDTGFD